MFFSIYKGAKEDSGEKLLESEYFSYWFHGLWENPQWQFFEIGELSMEVKRDGDRSLQAGVHDISDILRFMVRLISRELETKLLKEVVLFQIVVSCGGE